MRKCNERSSYKAIKYGDAKGKQIIIT